MAILEAILWGSLALVAYVYLVYPGLVGLLAVLVGKLKRRTGAARRQHHGDDASWPAVSLIIVASDQERVILDRLQCAVSQDYPPDRMEVIVGCHGALDLTGDLVSTFDDPRVRVVQNTHQRDRATVVNDCVAQATGEIVVVCRAACMLEPDTIRMLARHFLDPAVGGVAGRLILRDPTTGQAAGGAYRAFENQLIRWEALLGVLLNANGAVYAFRRTLYAPLPNEAVADDMYLAMQVHLAGRAFVYDDAAVVVERMRTDSLAGFHRDMQIGAALVQNLFQLCRMLQSFNGRLALAFLSHKVLRWFCPMFLIAAMMANAMLSRDPFYLRVLLLHELVYVLAFTGLWLSRYGRRWPWRGHRKMAVDVNASAVTGSYSRSGGHDSRWPESQHIRGGES